MESIGYSSSKGQRAHQGDIIRSRTSRGPQEGMARAESDTESIGYGSTQEQREHQRDIIIPRATRGP